jgi:ATP-dependent 26S proteasome regulatory subunit
MNVFYNTKVIAATNRIDILDPALLRSGRLDRKIEFPHPNEEARARIMQIHSRKMTVSPDVNFDELARSCDEFNGAQCKAVCVEAGMIALRRGATEIQHEDFMEGIYDDVSELVCRDSRSSSKEKDDSTILCLIFLGVCCLEKII